MGTLRSLLAALALLALALPATAAASSRDVIRDCAEDGRIDGSYSDKELRQAEDDLPSDLDEYTDCREAIRGAIGGAGGRGGSGGGGGGGDRVATDPSLLTGSGAVASTREDVDALDSLAGSRDRDEAPALGVGGKRIAPGEGSGAELLGVANAANDLPASVLSAIAAIVLMALAGTAFLLRHRIPLALAALRERVPSLRGKRPTFGIRRRVGLPRFLRR